MKLEQWANPAPDTIKFTITSTGKPGDAELTGVDGLTHKPYNGPYRIDWGDGSPIQTVQQPVDAVGPPVTSVNDPTIVQHQYTQFGSFRGYVEGDARIRFHAMPSKVPA